MTKWYEKPIELLTIKKDIDYIMCVDENGSNGNLNHILKQLSNEREFSVDDMYFTVTGCIFTRNEYIVSKKDIELLKNKYWNNGRFFDDKSKKEKYVCLHSRDIRKHIGCYKDSIINYNEFMIDLTNTMRNVKCKIISISINLYEYLKKGYTHNVYNVAFDFLLESYIYATLNNKKGIVMLEGRGKDEDYEL